MFLRSLCGQWGLISLGANLDIFRNKYIIVLYLKFVCCVLREIKSFYCNTEGMYLMCNFVCCCYCSCFGIRWCDKTFCDITICKWISPGKLSENKSFSSFYANGQHKRTNNIHLFEGCFLRSQVSSTVWKFSTLALLNFEFFWSVSKKKLRICCFQKMLWLDDLLSSVPV